MNEFYWSNQEDNLLKSLYIKKESKMNVLLSFPHRSYGAIKHRAKFLKIRKTRTQIKDEKFFEIPNEINCSIAGMIASDGNVQKSKKKNGFRLIMCLKREDEPILKDIITTTKSNANILQQKVNRKLLGSKVRLVDNPQFKDYFSSTVTFSSAKKWMDDLQKYWNITENKSLTLTAPSFNDLNLSLAYILGIINGDGTIGIQKTGNKNYFYIRLLGTRNLLEWAKNRFEEALREKIDGEVHVERDGASVYLLQVNGIQAIKLFEQMRVLNCIQLARKWSNPQILKLVEDYKLKNPSLFPLNPI